MKPIVYNESMSDKEIDRLVHQHVFGNPAAYMVPPYCSDVCRWWRVVENILARGKSVSITSYKDKKTCMIEDRAIKCDRMGRSVCVASLMHLGVMVDTKDAKENATISSMVASAESLAACAGVGIDDHGSDPPQPCDVKECELPAGSCCG